jgi:perosamine synthetase
MVTDAELRDPLIPLARPSILEAEIHAVERVMRSGRLFTGPENQRFETMLAAVCGREHAICVTSGAAALELALWALWESDARARAASAPREVLVPAAGFPAAANAVLRLGLRPVAVDIAPDSWTMDAGAAERAITSATWALISIDSFGQVAEIEPLRALCAGAGIHLINDAACSLGALDSRGQGGGSYGVMATLSFHPRQVITTGEGGAVLCDDPDLADTLRQIRDQGQSAPGCFVRAGTSARLSETAAALGMIQLQRLDAMLRERALLVQGYHQRLDALRQAGALSWQAWLPEARPAHQSFAVMLGENAARNSDQTTDQNSDQNTDQNSVRNVDHPDVRSRVRQHLSARGIETAVAAYSLHRLQARAALPGIAQQRCPVADALHDRGLALPLFVGMRSAELDRVAGALAEVLHG